MSEFPKAADVIVLGSGAAGLSAAVVAKHFGAEVLLLERDSVFGGSTAMSGGVVWVPCNPMMESVGHRDTPEEARTYIASIAGNKFRPDLVDAFIAHGAEMVHFMHGHTALRLIPRALAPDYQPHRPGAKTGGRALDPQVYDGAALGPWFRRLRRPIREFLVLGGMMVSARDIAQLMRTLHSPRDFWASTKMVSSYLLQRLRHPRGTRLVQGNSLAAQLMKSALDAGVPMFDSCDVVDLQKTGDRVDTVRFRHGGREHQITARCGIVLAGGGAPASEAFVKTYTPTPQSHFTMAPKENKGGLQKLALRLGGRLAEDVVDPVSYTPVSLHKKRDGTVIRFPHLFLDRAKPGLIAVNTSGRRFVDEASSYHDFMLRMLDDSQGGSVPAWLICDEKFLGKYGMGLVRPGLYPRKPYLDSGYLRKAATLQALAREIGVDPSTLAQTVTRHNDFARAGVDEDFGKGSNIYDSHLGDPAVKPNPCLAPIETAPFYAIQIVPGDIGSTIGLQTDGAARVVDADHRPIPGLYAVGNDMNSVMSGTYPGAGITLGPALTFGYIVGKELGGMARP
ncbi:FAD-dependent oxidoreductase [Pontitalea aquivivens]|uniref:FAD-dependent oxidoreductase n=1 Tax=Pontitalea aquivivens TaxID=3388663 RepID=UPI0039707CCB